MPLTAGTTVRRVSAKVTAGSYVLNKASTSTWYEIDSTNLRLTLNAVVGDLLMVSLHALWSNENVQGAIDFASIVSGSPVNYWGTAGGGTDSGVTSLYGPNGILHSVSCNIGKLVVSGDISSGQVTVSPFVRLAVAGSNKTLFAASTAPLFMAVENRGPVTSP